MTVWNGISLEAHKEFYILDRTLTVERYADDILQEYIMSLEPFRVENPPPNHTLNTPSSEQHRTCLGYVRQVCQGPSICTSDTQKADGHVDIPQESHHKKIILSFPKRLEELYMAR